MGFEGISADAEVFVRMQLGRYLGVRRRGRFTGPAERDAVLSMIRDAWVELACSGTLDGLSPAGRRAVFATCLIVFPTFVAGGDADVVPVDFPRRSRIRARREGLSDGRSADGFPAWPTIED